MDGRHLDLQLGTPVKLLAVLLLPIALAACAGSDDGKPITYTDDRGVAEQPYPNSYRAEILSFMKTYLNNPVGLHDAAMAEPVQRTVGGRVRYVSCLRFTPRESDGSYRQPRERAILYVDGPDIRSAANRPLNGQKNLLWQETGKLCCCALNVQKHHCSGIAPKQPN
jgi:hypothetical protein